jgi:hypothetical protein
MTPPESVARPLPSNHLMGQSFGDSLNSGPEPVSDADMVFDADDSTVDRKAGHWGLRVSHETGSHDFHGYDLSHHPGHQQAQQGGEPGWGFRIRQFLHLDR